MFRLFVLAPLVVVLVWGSLVATVLLGASRFFAENEGRSPGDTRYVSALVALPLGELLRWASGAPPELPSLLKRHEELLASIDQGAVFKRCTELPEPDRCQQLAEERFAISTAQKNLAQERESLRVHVDTIRSEFADFFNLQPTREPPLFYSAGVLEGLPTLHAIPDNLPNFTTLRELVLEQGGDVTRARGEDPRAVFADMILRFKRLSADAVNTERRLEKTADELALREQVYSADEGRYVKDVRAYTVNLWEEQVESLFAPFEQFIDHCSALLAPS